MTTKYMWPNPNVLNLQINGRTYQATVSTPIQVQDVDIPIAQANGWQRLTDFEDAAVAVFGALLTGSLLKSNNLSDVASAYTSRVNLGVENIALQDTLVGLTQANGAAGNIAWNLAAGRRAAVTITANANVVLPTNIPTTGRAVIVISQNAGSNSPCTFNASAFKFASGANTTLTATNAAVDMFVFECDGGNNRLLCAEIVKAIG